MPDSPCGCPWDGLSCPHCGRTKSHVLAPARAEHMRRCHEAATGYPVEVTRE